MAEFRRGATNTAANIVNFKRQIKALGFSYDWEREIDQLMDRQVKALDQAQRKAIFDQVQKIVAEQLPIIYFAAPHIYLAASTRVEHATPALLRPAILWNADELGVRR